MTEQQPPIQPPEQHSDLTHNIGSKVSHSLAWMLASSIIVKGLSFVAQVIMGWFLSDGDFGVFAIAFAIIGLATFVREGGSRDYLIQQGPRKYDELVGPLFWMAMTITIIIAGLLVALAGLLYTSPSFFPEAYRDTRLPWLLLIGTVTMILATPSAFTSAKLQLELRFDILGKVQIASGLIRYAVMIALALVGGGPFAFLLAFLAVQIFELIIFTRIVPVGLFKQPAHKHLWKGYLTLTIWLAIGFFGNFLVEWGNAAGVGLFASKADVGIYYFAFNLVVQLVILLSVNAQYVLMPALSRLNEQSDRQSIAILRVTRALMLLAAALCLGFGSVAESAMNIVWHGRWDSAVLAVQIFSIFFPLRMTYGLTLAVMQAKGEFKRWAITSIAEASAMFAAAAAGAWVGVHVPAVHDYVDSPAAMAALAIGVTLAIARSYITSDVLTRTGATLRQRMSAQYPAWFFALCAAVGCWSIDYSIVGREQWGHVTTSLTPMLSSPRLASTAMEILRAAMLGSTFTFLFASLVRVFLPEHVREAVAFAPAKLRGLAATVLFIKA